MFRFSSLNMMLALSSIRLRKFPSLPSLLSVVAFYQKLLSCNDHVTSLLYSVNRLCCTDFFSHAKPALHCWDKSSLIVVCVSGFHLLIFVEIFFASILGKHLSVVSSLSRLEKVRVARTKHPCRISIPLSMQVP